MSVYENEQYCINCENENFDINKTQIHSTTHGDYIFCDEDCLIAWAYGV